MCDCNHGSLKLEKLQCNKCEFTYYQVDDSNKEESLLCPKCKEGFGVVIEEAE